MMADRHQRRRGPQTLARTARLEIRIVLFRLRLIVWGILSLVLAIIALLRRRIAAARLVVEIARMARCRRGLTGVSLGLGLIFGLGQIGRRPHGNRCDGFGRPGIATAHQSLEFVERAADLGRGARRRLLRRIGRLVISGLFEGRLLPGRGPGQRRLRRNRRGVLLAGARLRIARLRREDVLQRIILADDPCQLGQRIDRLPRTRSLAGAAKLALQILEIEGKTVACRLTHGTDPFQRDRHTLGAQLAGAVNLTWCAPPGTRPSTHLFRRRNSGDRQTGSKDAAHCMHKRQSRQGQPSISLINEP